MVPLGDREPLPDEVDVLLRGRNTGRRLLLKRVEHVDRVVKELGEMAMKGSAFWSAAPAVLQGEVLPSIGGVPIMKGGRVIGAIGCGGGTGEQDHECAVAGAEAVAAH